jgi:aspartate carbamoyltransferase catalytic subunit
MVWHRQHLLDIESLTPEEILTVLDTAKRSRGRRARHQKSSSIARQNGVNLLSTIHAHTHQF